MHSDLGDYTEARAAYEKALEIRTKFLAFTHPDLAATYYNLASTYQKDNQLDKALTIYNKALVIGQPEYSCKDV